MFLSAFILSPRSKQEARIEIQRREKPPINPVPTGFLKFTLGTREVDFHAPMLFMFKARKHSLQTSNVCPREPHSPIFQTAMAVRKAIFSRHSNGSEKICSVAARKDQDRILGAQRNDTTLRMGDTDSALKHHCSNKAVPNP